MKKIILFGIVLIFLITLVLAFTGDDEFVITQGNDEFVITQGDDEFIFFQSFVPQSSSLIADGNGASGGGSSISSSNQNGNHVNISCLIYPKKILLFAKTGDTITKTIKITNDCSSNKNVTISCEGNVCNYLIYNKVILLINHTISNYNLTFNIPQQFTYNNLLGNISFNELNNTKKVNINVHISSSIFEKMTFFLKQESFIQKIPKILVFSLIFIIGSMLIYSLTFKFLPTLISILLSVAISIIGIIIYIIMQINK